MLVVAAGLVVRERAQRERALRVEELLHRLDRGVDLGEQPAPQSRDRAIARGRLGRRRADDGAPRRAVRERVERLEPEQQRHRAPGDLRSHRRALGRRVARRGRACAATPRGRGRSG